MNLSKYYTEICKEPLLSKEEERDLFLEMQDVGLSAEKRQAIRDRIIRASLRFVFKEAKNYSKQDPSTIGILISAGNEGLLVAMDKYELGTGYRFLTYAGWWVKQRILYQMSKQRIVSLPIGKQQLAARIQKEVDANPDITLDQLRVKFPTVSENDLRELYQTNFLTFYIEDVGEDPAFEINPIEDEVNAKLDREKLHALIEELPENHRTVLKLTFGIEDGRELKLDEIVEVTGFSKDKIKNLRRESLSLLKESMGGVNPFE